MKKLILILICLPLIGFGQCISGDCENGQGTKTFSNGNKYVGKWKDGNIQGQGTFTWANGDKYVGEFNDNNINGQGTKTYADGVIEKGVWKDSKLIESLLIESQIKRIVEQIINEWQEKGEFEKTEDYIKRVNETTRNQKIEKYQKEAIKKLIDFKKIELKEYDADNETFLLYSEQFGALVLPVPIDKAQYFKQNLSSIKFLNPDFIISNDKIVFIYLEVVDNNGDKYTYNNQNQESYASTKIDYNFSEIEVDLTSANYVNTNSVKKTNTIKVGKSDVDTEIPSITTTQQHTYALIIGNEDYSSFQLSLSSEVNVDFAENDAKVFKEYCQKTLGIPEKQIKLLANATYGQMNQGLAWLQNLAEVEGGKAELIFYYSGHGLPDEQTKEGYLIPVDISGSNVQSGLALKKVYKCLNEFPSEKVTVFLDACFSGGARNQGLVAMKSIRVKPKEESISGNMLVFASSSGDESSAVYREKHHGYFTYFLLKKLQETKGDVSYKELADYLIYQVKKETGLSGKIQTPQVNASSAAFDKWEEWKLK